MAEADRRWQEIEQGKVRSVSGRAAMARVRAALPKGLEPTGPACARRAAGAALL
jgi:hypothetical protein